MMLTYRWGNWSFNRLFNLLKVMWLHIGDPSSDNQVRTRVAERSSPLSLALAQDPSRYMAWSPDPGILHRTLVVDGPFETIEPGHSIQRQYEFRCWKPCLGIVTCNNVKVKFSFSSSYGCSNKPQVWVTLTNWNNWYLPFSWQLLQKTRNLVCTIA